jgi:hypothetical protein
MARDAQGHKVWISDPNAVSFCAAGAVIRVADVGNQREAIKILQRRAVSKGSSSLTHYNDTHTLPEVLQLFDEVING